MDVLFLKGHTACLAPSEILPLSLSAASDRQWGGYKRIGQADSYLGGQFGSFYCSKDCVKEGVHKFV